MDTINNGNQVVSMGTVNSSSKIWRVVIYNSNKLVRNRALERVKVLVSQKAVRRAALTQAKSAGVPEGC